MKTTPGKQMKVAQACEERLVKKSERVTRENEVLKSDRIELVDAANRLVGQMITKQIVPAMRSGYVTEPFELSAVEQAAYQSALSFLARQFDQGYSVAEVLERRVESDLSTDFGTSNSRSASRRSN
jgi:hypothetical protein